MYLQETSQSQQAKGPFSIQSAMFQVQSKYSSCNHAAAAQNIIEKIHSVTFNRNTLIKRIYLSTSRYAIVFRIKCFNVAFA